MLANILLASILSPALAQTSFEIVDEALLDAETAQYPNGVGAPSVIRVAERDLFYMFFESRTAAPGCDEAWTIGVATSPDGLNWTIGKPVVKPGRNAKHPCGARRPAAFSGDGAYYLAFNVLDEDRDDQVGILRVLDGQRATIVVPELDGILEPTVAKYGNEYVLLGVRDDNAIVAARSTDAAHWTLDATPAVPAGATTWAAHGHLSPSIVCNDTPTWEWEVYYGGWTQTEAAWAWAVSDDVRKWYVSLPIETWAHDGAWASFEALPAGSDMLVFYEALDEGGLPRIGLAASSAGFDASQATDRACAP